MTVRVNFDSLRAPKIPLIVISLLLLCPPTIGKSVEFKACLVDEKRFQQPFPLNQLKIQWDSWSTSQLVTAVASIILRDKLGFDVALDTGRTSKQTYQALSTGEVHLAFEVWPESNLKSLGQYVDKTVNGKESSKLVQYFPYTMLFGRSGIFESCSRQQVGSTFQTCSSGISTSPMLRCAFTSAMSHRIKRMEILISIGT